MLCYLSTVHVTVNWFLPHQYVSPLSHVNKCTLFAKFVPSPVLALICGLCQDSLWIAYVMPAVIAR